MHINAINGSHKNKNKPHQFLPFLLSNLCIGVKMCQPILLIETDSRRRFETVRHSVIAFRSTSDQPILDLKVWTLNGSRWSTKDYQGNLWKWCRPQGRVWVGHQAWASSATLVSSCHHQSGSRRMRDWQNLRKSHLHADWWESWRLDGRVNMGEWPLSLETQNNRPLPYRFTSNVFYVSNFCFSLVQYQVGIHSYFIELAWSRQYVYQNTHAFASSEQMRTNVWSFQEHPGMSSPSILCHSLKRTWFRRRFHFTTHGRTNGKLWVHVLHVSKLPSRGSVLIWRWVFELKPRTLKSAWPTWRAASRNLTFCCRLLVVASWTIALTAQHLHAWGAQSAASSFGKRKSAWSSCPEAEGSPERARTSCWSCSLLIVF